MGSLKIRLEVESKLTEISAEHLWRNIGLDTLTIFLKPKELETLGQNTMDIYSVRNLEMCPPVGY